MQVKVDFSVVDKFKDYLSRNDYTDKNDRQDFIDSLYKTESFNKQLQFYNGKISPEEYFNSIFSVLEGNINESTNEVIKVMGNSFRNTFSRKDALKKKIENLQDYDFTSLEDRVLSTLPKGTPINIDIYFVVDGFNAGSIVAENQMLIDALFWPSNKRNEIQIDGIILHEYHHLGFLYWLNRNEKRNLLVEKKDGKRLAVKLLESIISEGIATYFFNQNEDLTILIEESYGEIIAKAYNDSLENAKTDIAAFLYEFELDMKYLLTCKDDYEDMRQRIVKYNFSKEFGQPLNKAIGVYMCDVIHKGEGKDVLVESIIKPELFLEKYNKIAMKTNEIKLKEEVLEEWLKIWK